MQPEGIENALGNDLVLITLPELVDERAGVEQFSQRTVRVGTGSQLDLFQCSLSRRDMEVEVLRE